MKEKDLKEKARQDGAMRKAEMKIAASYLLSSLAYIFLDDADDILSEYKLAFGHDRQLLNRAINAISLYQSTFTRNCIEKGENIMIAGEIDRLKNFINDFIKKEIEECQFIKNQGNKNLEKK